MRKFMKLRAKIRMRVRKIKRWFYDLRWHFGTFNDL